MLWSGHEGVKTGDVSTRPSPKLKSRGRDVTRELSSELADLPAEPHAPNFGRTSEKVTDHFQSMSTSSQAIRGNVESQHRGALYGRFGAEATRSGPWSFICYACTQLAQKHETKAT